MHVLSKGSPCRCHAGLFAAAVGILALATAPSTSAAEPSPSPPAITLCPLASALVFTGAPLNSSTPGQLELAAKPGTCLVAGETSGGACAGHGCVVEAPCPTAANPCAWRGLCKWVTAPASGGEGVLVQVIDARGHPVCFDFDEELKQVQAFDCETTTGHPNRSAFQHWALSPTANETARDSAANPSAVGFTIRTTMANHSAGAHICARNTAAAKPTLTAAGTWQGN